MDWGLRYRSSPCYFPLVRRQKNFRGWAMGGYYRSYLWAARDVQRRILVVFVSVLEEKQLRSALRGLDQSVYVASGAQASASEDWYFCSFSQRWSFDLRKELSDLRYSGVFLMSGCLSFLTLSCGFGSDITPPPDRSEYSKSDACPATDPSTVWKPSPSVAFHLKLTPRRSGESP
jgi:hypothetical protein